MATNIGEILFSGLIATFVWFIVGGALFGNPKVKSVYRAFEHTGVLRGRGSVAQYLGLQFGGIALQCFIWAFVFAYVRPVLPVGQWMQGLIFGLILIGTKIIPRFWDMWVQSTYPPQLLMVEFVNGSIGAFIIGITFAFSQ